MLRLIKRIWRKVYVLACRIPLPVLTATLILIDELSP